jgi:hypothetical protein
VHPESIGALLIDHEFVVTSWKEFRVDVLSSFAKLIHLVSIGLGAEIIGQVDQVRGDTGIVLNEFVPEDTFPAGEVFL